MNWGFYHWDHLKTVSFYSLNMNFVPLLVHNNSWKCFLLFSRERRLSKWTDCSVVSYQRRIRCKMWGNNGKCQREPSHILSSAFTLCLPCLHVPFCSSPSLAHGMVIWPRPDGHVIWSWPISPFMVTVMGSGMGTWSEPLSIRSGTCAGRLGRESSFSWGCWAQSTGAFSCCWSSCE